MIALLRAVVWLMVPAGGLAALLVGAMLLVPQPGPEPVTGVRNADLHELPGSDREPWSVVILSDVQNGASYLPEIFERSRKYSPKAIVMTGDLASHPSEPYAGIPVWYLRRSSLPSPIFIVPGNHDISPARVGVPAGEGEEWFARAYGATTFEFRIGNTRFLGLNNAIGPVTGPALADLRSRLEAAKSRGERTILCLHRNILSFAEQPDPYAEPEHRALLDLIGEFEVPYVFCGHLHQEGYEERGSTRFVAVPASGSRPALDTEQKPIALTVLRWTGSSFQLGLEQFYRRNVNELKGVAVYMALAKIRPFFEDRPAATSALVAVAILTAAAGAAFLARFRRRTAA